MLRGSGQNGTVGGSSPEPWDDANAKPTGGEGPSNPPAMALAWNSVSPSLSTGTWKVARKGRSAERRVKDAGESEGRCVMQRIGVAPKGNITLPERAQTSGGSVITKTLRTLSRRCVR